MKKYILFLLITLILNGCATQPLSQKIEKIKVSPLPETVMPTYTKEVLPNGLTVFLIEDTSLPLINFYASIKSGSIYELETKKGLSEITFETIRTGGAGGLTGDEIDKTLENIGSRISFGVGRDIGWASGLVDKDNFTQIFNIFLDMLRKPRFEESKIELSKIRLNSIISRRDDNIEDLSSREFRKLIYGQENPYSRTIEYETIKDITQEEITQYHKRFFSPKNIILGIWGDFNKESMLENIKESMANWEVENPTLPLTPEENFLTPTSSINLITKKDATQSVIMMGHTGLRRDDPDYFTALVLSRILGTGWNSRFSRNIRQKEGLAYSAWAGFWGELGYTGIFSASVQTKAERTMEAVSLMQKEIQLISSNITDEELSISKESIINNEVFWSDTKDKIMERLIKYEYYGYPLDYPQKLIEGVKRVTKEDIYDISNRYIFLDKLTILIVGNSEKFGTPLPENINLLKP